VELDFRFLFEAHYDEIASYARRRQPDRSLADDVAQATFLEAWRSRATYDPDKGSPRSWLFGIATNLLGRHIRSEQRRLKAYQRLALRAAPRPDEQERVHELLDARRMQQVVAPVLAALPPGQYEVLTLFAYADLSESEISQALGVAPGTVKSRLSRARAALRARLATEVFGASDG
jgi:RNA polymerase sigma factor (sigma-70 family)